MRDTARHRWAVASRVLAASAGGYALTSLLTIAVSLLLPLAGVDLAAALLGTTMASFLVWVAIVMAVFHARSASRAWAWLAGGALVSGVVLWLLLPGAGA